MPQIIIQQKVEDYQRWKAMFDSLDGLRKSYGEISGKIFRNVERPTEVTVLFEWDHIRNVFQYSRDKKFKEAVKASGTLIDPIVYLPDGEL
jgi:hypothetical protein